MPAKHDQFYVPTPSDIRKACLGIQGEWTPQQEQNRRGIRGCTAPYEIPKVNVNVVLRMEK